jgi:cytochrome c biogenesis protein CcmG/thiol:disulfide interchange protein DsbE
VAKSGRVPIYGLNYKDERADALNWLGALGNPYTASVYDHEGKVGIDWGVYGVPETFVVDGKGIIRHKHVGPVSPQVWQDELLPLIERIENEAG